MSPQTKKITSEPILFVDDEEVLYRAGTRLTAETANRSPRNPVIPGGERPWEGLLGWCSVHHDSEAGEYKLWYQAFNKGTPASDPMSCVVCVATSTDGVSWERPGLSRYSWKGEPSNIVIVGNGGHSYRYGANVIEDPLRTFGDRFVMAHYDFGRIDGAEFPGLHLAHSDDGLEWQPLDRGPIVKTAYGMRGSPVPYQGGEPKESELWFIPNAMADATDFFFDESTSRYVWYGKVWLDGPDGTMGWKHGLGFTSSPDLTTWDEPEIVLFPDDSDADYVEFHTGAVFKYGGMYFCLLQILNRGERAGIIDVELATSRDGRRWDRPFRDSRFIYRNDEKEFDGGSVLTNSTPVFLPEETRFYYGGYSTGATGTLGVKESIRTGVGYASIGRDRFASVRSASGRGQITLKPRRLPQGAEIAVNTEATSGAVSLELLDRQGYRIPGFEAESCVPIRSDGLSEPVRWKSQAGLPDGEVLIRIHLEDAGIYALYIT